MQQKLTFDGQTRVAVYLATFLLPLLLLAVVFLQPIYEPKWMFLDSLTAAQLSGDCCHTYYGFVSNLGILLWAATASVLLFAATVLFASGERGRSFQFALFGGLLSGWLTLDDMFLLHELVLPTLGVPQLVVVGVYVVLALAYLGASAGLILRSEYLILLAGGGALVVSIVVDSVFHSLLPQLVYIEDSAKFFGIFCWFSFHTCTATQILRLKITASE